MTRVRFAQACTPAGALQLQLRVAGHAGYASKGQDIVCAAVSILAESLAAALQQPADGLQAEVCWQPAAVTLTAVCAAPQQARVQALYEGALAGYRLLAQHYPSFVTVCTVSKAKSCREKEGNYHED